MPIITERAAVLEVFAEAQTHGWVIPAFGTENLSTTEAVLAGAEEYGNTIGRPDLPIMVAVTNRYPERTQTAYYTHTRDWRIGLELFLADLTVLTAENTRFGRLRVLIHLDHIQHDLDIELWSGALGRFSSIMFDASTLSLDENLTLTRKFARERQSEIVIEGACDYVGKSDNHLTRVEEAERFAAETKVDWIVANLGTEHRAGVSKLHYARERAREISAKIGRRLVLHGASSVAKTELPHLFADGIAKVNLWTALERDSTAALFHAMLAHAAKLCGPAKAREWADAGLLGPNADLQSPLSIDYFTTAWRQQFVFEEMKNFVKTHLAAWYPASPEP